MKRLNLTLAVEADLLRDARMIASQKLTSVNEMVRNFLQEVVNKDARRLAALAKIQPLLDHPPFDLAPGRLTRDQLHER